MAALAYVSLLSACSAYDAALIGNSAPTEDAATAEAGMSHAGTSADTDASQAGAGAAGTGASGMGAQQMDAGSVASGKCHPNPNLEDEVCTMVCPETCNGLDDDCDRRIDEDETDYAICNVAHATAICDTEKIKCVITECLAGFRDCDHAAADGCEVVADDPLNCGVCGHVCKVEAGVAGCKDGECVQTRCNDKRADCDDDPLTCETPTDTLEDCGKCGESCGTVVNGSPSCVTGKCGIETCSAGYDDCDGKATTGCEQPLDTLKHCGACNQKCSFPGSQAECASSAGVCKSTGCEVGYDECDGDLLDGCESLKTGTNCGQCGKACTLEALQHVAAASCATSSCVIQCATGWGDCDGDAQTGCETQLNSLTHCGKCAKACDIPNALETCETGSCEKVKCDKGFGDCTAADGCETSLDTLANCGGCNTPCDKLSCGGGVCTAVDCSTTGGYGDCDGDGVTCEKNLLADIDNCGSCGNKCEPNVGVTLHGSLACTAQGCKATCTSGFGDCDGDYRNGCEQPLDTLNHCGACAVGCAIANATATCTTGSCLVSKCNVDFDDCDGNMTSCESALNTPARCGSCTNTCSYPNAVEGCGGTPMARTCTVSACDQPYYKNCDNTSNNGCEIDTRSDKRNCNACGNDCEALPNVATASCASSACSITTCDPGFGDCTAISGCETPINTVQNCGACGNNCDTALANTASTTCDSATLACKVGTCKPGFSNCDGIAANGCETNIFSVQNCGGCASMGQNQACQNLAHANTACAAGSCTLTSCQTDWADCDGNLANGCERDIRPPASGGLGPCVPDTGCTKTSSAGHDYYVCSTARTWSDARSKCRLQRYADLARVDSSTEATFLSGKLTAISWIGNTDAAREGLWIWADNGVPFWQGVANGSAVDAAYTNWAANEPNATGNCGEIYLNGTYDDTGCTATKPFVCEVNPDACPSDANKYDPGQCGCGVADTDADADGFAACKDACESDANKRAVGICGCGVPDTDTDADSQADCKETCDNDPAKFAPGICGCGTPDTDTDSDTFADCVEMCDADPAKQDPGLCGCGVADTNTDGDSQPDCNETCDSDATKLAPGACGCDVADTNTDGDSQADCNETCDSDPLKLAPGICGCGVADTNTDGDSQADCNETCDSDPLKLAPGVCGCGVADTNTDGDSQPDCNETCDNDPKKLAPGVCGCGVADTDSDGDGTPNCNDTCPYDSTNVAGCYPYLTANVPAEQWPFTNSPTWNCTASGTTTIDSTAGTITSTTCTIGALDVTNGVAQYVPGLAYGKLDGWDRTTANPKNLAFDSVGPSITELNTEVATGSNERWVDGVTYVYTGEIYITATGVASFMEHIDDFVYLTIDGTTVLDNDAWFTPSAGKFTGTQGWHTFELRLYDATGGQGPSEADPKGLPALGYSPTDTGASVDFSKYTWPRNTDANTASLFRSSVAGANVMVVRLKGISLTNSHVIKVVGNKPVVILVRGNVSLAAGTKIDASAILATPGAGGNLLCANNGAGGNAPGTSPYTGGAGGGGFGTAGGKGSTGDNGPQAAGTQGIARGNATLLPLLGGCPGGNTNACGAGGGAGGGALQISASGTFSGTGTITSNGGNGSATSCGSGGGSGGGILLQASTLSYTGTITLNGGNGSTGTAGGPTGASGSTNAAAAGGNGSPGNGADGGSGGGGGYGRKRLN